MGWYLVYLTFSTDKSKGCWQVKTWSEQNAVQECHVQFPGCWVEKVVYLGKD